MPGHQVQKEDCLLSVTKQHKCRKSESIIDHPENNILKENRSDPGCPKYCKPQTKAHKPAGILLGLGIFFISLIFSCESSVYNVCNDGKTYDECEIDCRVQGRQSARGVAAKVSEHCSSNHKSAVADGVFKGHESFYRQ